MAARDELTGVLPADVIGIMRNEWTKPFWDATAEHRLLLPRCAACGEHRFPPSPFCPTCRSQEMEWVEHDGRGEIYSFTVIRHGVIAGGVRLVGNVVDTEPEAVAVGLPVALDWYDVRAGDTVPVFRL
jgi:uncharacterized OB-fold protein